MIRYGAPTGRFRGIYPKLSPLLLPDGAATTAVDCHFRRGSVTPVRCDRNVLLFGSGTQFGGLVVGRDDDGNRRFLGSVYHAHQLRLTKRTVFSIDGEVKTGDNKYNGICYLPDKGAGNEVFGLDIPKLARPKIPDKNRNEPGAGAELVAVRYFAAIRTADSDEGQPAADGILRLIKPTENAGGFEPTDRVQTKIGSTLTIDVPTPDEPWDNSAVFSTGGGQATFKNYRRDGAEIVLYRLTNASVGWLEIGSRPISDEVDDLNEEGDVIGKKVVFVDTIRNNITQPLVPHPFADLEYSAPPQVNGIEWNDGQFVVAHDDNHIYLSGDNRYVLWAANQNLMFPRTQQIRIAEGKIIGIAVYQRTIFAFPENSAPVVIVVNSPDDTPNVYRPEIVYPCVSGKSIARVRGGVIYASRHGLVMLTAGGGAQLITEAQFDRLSFAQYNPQDIKAQAIGDEYYAHGNGRPLVWDGEAGGGGIRGEISERSADYAQIVNDGETLFGVSGRSVYEIEGSDCVYDMCWKSRRTRSVVKQAYSNIIVRADGFVGDIALIENEISADITDSGVQEAVAADISDTAVRLDERAFLAEIPAPMVIDVFNELIPKTGVRRNARPDTPIKLEPKKKTFDHSVEVRGKIGVSEIMTLVNPSTEA